jgi:hypothetical protein
LEKITTQLSEIVFWIWFTGVIAGSDDIAFHRVCRVPQAAVPAALAAPLRGSKF